MQSLTIGCVALMSLAGQLGVDSSSPHQAQVRHCLISPIRDVEVPAQVTGLLLSVNVQEGDKVKASQLLAQIDDRLAKLDKYAAERKLHAAVTRANDDIEVKYAMASYEVAEAELAQNVQINRNSPGSVPSAEIRRLTLAKERARFQIDKTKLDLRVARMTAEVEEATVRSTAENIQRRQITSPIEGTVINVVRESGEWINAGEALARIVQMDQLRVEGFLYAREHDPSRIEGKSVSVHLELTEGRRETFHGTVTFVSPLIQAGNKYRVAAVVNNRKDGGNWLLRPGTEATMTIQLR